MSCCDFVEIEQVSVGIGNQGHEATPGLLRWLHRKVHTEFRQANVFRFQIGDRETNSRVSTDQVSLVGAGERQPQLDGTRQQRRITVFSIGELQFETELRRVELDCLVEVIHKEIDVRDFHRVSSGCAKLQPLHRRW